MDKIKLVKNISKTALGVTAAYLGIGGIICDAVISKSAVNKKPDELLSDKKILNKYNKYPHFREADDWFVRHNPVDVVMENKDGIEIRCNIIRQKRPTHKWAVVCHGYTSRPRLMAMQGKHYYDKGYNVLFPVMCGHLTDERKHTSMGYYEHRDVLDWINSIVETDAGAKILIHGCSMGAATTMLVTGEELPSNVKVAVEDCGYTSCWDEFATQIGDVLHLPVFPFLHSANAVSKLFFGWSFKDCSPVDAVAKSKTPTFFVHGLNDTFVPYSMLQILYDACSADKGILSVPDAMHDESCLLHPEIYWPDIDKFTEQYI